ncbi:MAG: hypothetical protein WEB90_01215 [Gemmatimonadota bacterium]
MSKPSRWEKEAARAGSEAARRAIRRLDVLEWVILAAAAVLATVGGLVVAMLFVGRSGEGFRSTWIVAALLLLIVPGVIALVRQRMDERRAEAGALEERRDEDG